MANDKQELIDQFHKNSVEIVKVVVQEFRGEPYIDMRIWALVRPAEPGSEVATKKGICISPDLLPKLIKALEKAEARVKTKVETGPESGQNRQESPQNSRSGKG